MGIVLRGEAYTDRHARYLINSIDFLDVIPTEEGAPLTYTDVSSLGSYLINHYQNRRKKHA